MIAYKCAKCGGELEPLGDGRKAICPWCTSVMVLPTLDPEAFNRATELRQRREFDQAQAAFEHIVAENPQDSESYWNLVLCKYGIEYVKDRDGSRVPTCNRMSYQPILEDPDYRKALQYADGFSKGRYEEEAGKIDRVLKRIAQISQSQPAFDIFISYKESDENGHRTLDSNIAQNIYDAILERHPDLKVFLSRVTLNNIAAGMEYEPVIFSALNTAKVMLVVGTSRENLESVWVRNEWSRYCAMMERDNSKKMAVVYKEMDIRDIPRELGGYKMQHMEAEGFYMQDLLRGIDGMLGVRERQQAAAIDVSGQVSTAANNLQVQNLLRRAAQEANDSKQARAYYNKAIDVQADCAEAWWGLLLLETRNLQYIKNSEEFNLSREAQRQWNMVKRYAVAPHKEEYEERMEDYEQRWMTSYNHRRTNELFEEMRSKTDNGRLFDRYSYYGPVGEGAAKCLQTADAEQEREIRGFLTTYKSNHDKFRELQDWKRSKPVDMLRNSAGYQEIVSRQQEYQDKVDRSLVAQNGFFGWDVGLGFIAVIAAFLCMIVAFPSISSQIAPLIVATSFFLMAFKVIHYRGRLGEPLRSDQMEDYILQVGALAILGYFAFQFQMYLAAKKYIDGLTWTCILWGVLMLVTICVIIGSIVLIFSAGFVVAAVVFVIGLGICITLEEALSITALPTGVLQLIMPGLGLELLVLAGIAALVSATMHFRNKGAIEAYDVNTGNVENADKEMEEYINTRINPVLASYQSYMDSKYLQDAQQVDQEG